MALGVNLAVDEILTATWETAPQQVGTVVQASDGSQYRLIKNNSTETALSQYYIAYLNSAATQDWGCENDGGLAERLAVGICMTGIATGEYGWVCCAGICTGNAVASVETVGFPLYAQTGVFTVATGADAAGNLAAQGRVLARGLEITAAAGTLLVDVCGAVGM